MIKKELTLKKDTKKESEIAALARMVANGFNHMLEVMDEKFEAVDKRFDKLEDRVDILENKVDGISDLLHSVVMPTLEAHDGRIKRIEKTAFA
ncbi:MAG: Vegetative insecticide protein terminal [Parcubacteria group bacterium]|nr:Vegetative insecticide protein terminal [Parcubacteria group bacterium]